MKSKNRVTTKLKSPSKKSEKEDNDQKPPKKEKVDPAAGTKDIRSFFVSLEGGGRKESR